MKIIKNKNNLKVSLLSFALVFLLPLNAYALDLKHYLQVFNNAEFSRFASSLSKHLINRDIIKDENSWEITSNASIARESMGLVLFNMLDSSFLQAENPNIKRYTAYFKDGNYSKLVLSPTSFTFNRGSDIFKAEVIARLNWDKTGKEDWLVFFSLTNPQSDLVGRYFYIIVSDITKTSLKSEVVASQNNLTNTFKIYADEMPEYKIQQMLEDRQRQDEEAKKQAEKDANSKEEKAPVKTSRRLFGKSDTKDAEPAFIELDTGQYSVLEKPEEENKKKGSANSSTEIKLNN